MKAYWLLLALGCAACGDASVTGPSATQAPTATLDTVSVVPAVVDLSVLGPSGCVAVDTLPAVVSWVITGLPVGAQLDKGYHWDDSVNCDSTEQQQRTQNSHLRIVPTSATSVRIEFDRDVERCTGRQQVDISLDGRVLIGVVLTRASGKDCRVQPIPLVKVPPEAPPPTPPVLTPIAPPPPLVTPPTPHPPATPPVLVPPSTVPPPCLKPKAHHCEQTKTHHDCHSWQCQKDHCHDTKGGGK